jgi:hypothetical protein
MKPAYARLHVLLASDTRVGLVIRHGTAKSVCTLLWDRKKDKFELGQWMRGRIVTERCDLPPDGQHFLYMAARYAQGVSQSWAVVSRTPYLKAVAYYPWRWGGWFLNNRDYCMPGNPHGDDRESPEVRRVEADPPMPSLFAARLVRAGWTIEDSRARFAGRIEFVRPAGAGWELRHRPRGGYRLSCGELVADTLGWDWADMDGKRLVWAVKGCLWAGIVRKDGIQKTRLLHDFNGMQFEPLAAPYEGGRPVPQRQLSPPPRRASRSPVDKKSSRSKAHREEGRQLPVSARLRRPES